MATNAMENLDPKTDQKLRSVHNTIDVRANLHESVTNPSNRDR